MLLINKKLFRIAVIVLCTILVLVTLSPMLPPSLCFAKISLYVDKITIGIGEEFGLNLKGTYESASWESNNEEVASVDVNGFVTGNKKGKAVITATFNGKKYPCNVTVIASPLKYSKLGVRKDVTVSLKDTTYSKSIKWKSSDPSIASISTQGVITAKKNGRTIISASSDHYEYHCIVCVLPSEPEELAATTTFNSITMEEKDFYEYSLDNKSWQSSNLFTGLKSETEYTVYYRIGKIFQTAATKSKSSKVSTDSVIYSTLINNDTYDNELFLYSNYDCWAEPDPLNYYVEADGNIDVIAHEDGKMTIHRYNSSLQYLSVKTIKLPYPIWGGFYAGEDGYFYIAVGECNQDEADDKVTYCILKYNSAWSLLDKAEINGGESNTTTPYRAGACSMALFDKTLILYASRERYTDEDDGRRHESNFTAYIDTNTMDVFSIAESYPPNHVSHTMNQFVKVDGDNLLFVDHGDGYPRSVVLQTYSAFRVNSDVNNYTDWSSIDLLGILGEVGDNHTGTTVSGFEIGEHNNIVIGNSVPHSYSIQGTSGFDLDFSTNIYLGLTQKDGSESKILWLTDFDPKGNTYAGIPRLVKISNDRFAILYQIYIKRKYDSIPIKMCCQLTDSDGNVISSRYYGAYFPSSSNPVILDNNIVWIGFDEDSDGANARWFRIPL